MIINYRNTPCLVLEKLKLGPEPHYKIIHKNDIKTIAIQKSGLICDVFYRYWDGTKHREYKIKFADCQMDFHREHGPAINALAKRIEQEWFLFGKRHRLDGPAYFLSGSPIKNYFVDGVVCFTRKEYLKLVEKYKNDHNL